MLFIGAMDGIPRASPKVLARVPAVLRWARESLQAVQDAILRPAAIVSDTFRIQQRWELFTSSRDERFRLWIEARAADHTDWRVLFRAHDPEHRLFGPVLEYRRVRAAWNPSRRGVRVGYTPFVTWVARRVFSTDPRWQTVRVRAEQIRIVPRGSGFVGTGSFVHTQERRRGEVPP